MSMSDTAQHVSVLLHESVDLLGPSLVNKDTKQNIFLDGTLGNAGHSAAILEAYSGTKLIGLDRDPDALKRAEETLLRSAELRTGKGLRTLPSDIVLVKESFRNLDLVLKDLQIEKVDAILLDLGLSSPQLDVSGRGFSFQRDEPLDMRMADSGLTAADVLNHWDEDTLELIIRGFGEERYSWKISREIVRVRETKSFKTTFDLIEAVRAATPAAYHHQRTNPATKTFQAIRIAVNEELTALEDGLKKGFEALNPGGRMAVISFHSLEDRIVKNFFRDRVKEELAHAITKKPIVPTDSEVEANPRSRSGKLRVVEKI
jgi:16S rRNA (cytosine1402-N4)-methyltransferase